MAILIGMVFVIISDMFLGRISLNSVPLLLHVNFVIGFRLEFRIHVHIPHFKYQVKPHSFPWLFPACPAAIVHRNLFFFFFINRINPLNLK